MESVLTNNKPFPIRLDAENPTLKKVKYVLQAVPRDGDTANTLLSVTITISPLHIIICHSHHFTIANYYLSQLPFHHCQFDEF